MTETGAKCLFGAAFFVSLRPAEFVLNMNAMKLLFIFIIDFHLLEGCFKSLL
jgi:hypothetical protein